MNPRQLPLRDYQALKQATGVSVGGAGTLRQLAEDIGRKRWQVFSDWCDASQMDRFVPLDVIADLEAIHGSPVITRALAKLSNCIVVPLPDARSASPGLCLGEIARTTGALISSMAEALADNRIDAKERTQLLGDIDKAMRVLAHIRLVLEQMAADDASGAEVSF